ncbi:MAG: hypothetical protein ACQGVK_17655 [Myxococcota bacterium]
MELWLTLTALYAWQCLVWLPGRSLAFVPSFRGAGALSGPGPRWLSPWPGALGIVASPLPFHPRGDRLVADVPLSRSAGAFDRGERSVELGAGSSAELVGSRLAVDGRPFVPGASRAEARVWLVLAALLARKDPAERTRELRRHLEASLDPQRLDARLAEARRGVRGLAIACNAQSLALLAGVPSLGLWMGAERAILLSAPVLLALHLTTVALAIAAHRRLFPERRAERIEEIATAALYPPALLRLPQRWIDAALAGFHPLAVARALWPEPKWRQAWRRALARLERSAADPSEDSEWIEAQRGALQEAVSDLPDWSTPRRRSDPTASSYCPICLDDYRAGFARCAECGTATVAYAPPTGAADPDLS